jgi:pyroglutamyl-peptidase
MADAIEKAGIPATVSNSAGAFVCNDTLYGILHHYAGTDVRCGFIHVPFIPEQGEPSMELENIVKALEIAICACGE